MNAKPALVRPRYASDLDSQAAKWIIRLSINYAIAFKQFNEGMYAEELRQMVGISPREGKLSKSSLLPLLKRRLQDLEDQSKPCQTVLDQNVEMLAKLLDMDSVQSGIVTLAALAYHHQYLSEVIDEIRTTSIDAIIKILAVTLNVADADIRKAIRPDGNLLATRLITIDLGNKGRGLQIEFPRNLCSALFVPSDNLQMLMRAFFENAPRPQLKGDSFLHLAKETDLLSAYLSKAAKDGKAKGINILIYGPPGTGKTEYVRWLASHLGRVLYQVRAMDDQGAAVSGQDRLAFFQVSQRFLQKSDALILFDEIEDVFPGGDSGLSHLFQRKGVAGKMFINRLLESNPIPTIWVSNEVSHIDKAYLRRFDFSFEMGIPPIAVRRRILRKYLRGQQISAKAFDYLAQQEELSPAQIEKAVKVLKGAAEPVQNKEATLLFLIENSRVLLSQEKNDAQIDLTDCSYQLDYLNPDCDLKQLLSQLKRLPNSVGALCFYGAPGTGKTALAHHIAREIQLPLLVRRASDIISPYVGETEQKIALMFRQAKQDGAVLLLDEADSFLSERQLAKNSWEVTAVNEMLTQMESFEGLFICSTNLMQRLDAASLRRFALKIKFDYLKPEQRWKLFISQAKKLSHSQEPKYRGELMQLNNLTPGDFATVRRQAKLLSITLTAEELIHRLKQECKTKDSGTKQQIGFVHAS